MKGTVMANCSKLSEFLPSGLSDCGCCNKEGMSGLSGLSISSSTILWVIAGAGAGVAVAHYSGKKDSMMLFGIVGGFIGALID
ncbi:hypothetical protein [Flavobacterium filum]|uniref:hypothetical protein n=1 Tax=Flavobacterium filum TaxID=370974 RepID=UPI0023F13BFF|nr:hypothetical protein [Flavobacterium filum]